MSAQAQPSQDSQPLIRLRGITKVYGEGALAFQALKGVDLDIAAGEFLAIMGQRLGQVHGHERHRLPGPAQRR